jgi:Tol biopolymer transport system component
VYTYRLNGPDIDPLSLHQLSAGAGTSGNPSLDKAGKNAVFMSTSDPATGVDTSVAQIWTVDLRAATGQVLTAGAGTSANPQISPDGHAIVFQSTTDLAGDRSDTGVPQIFVVDLKTQLMIRLTGDLPGDVGGCVDPSIVPYRRDWRVAFLCGGEPQYTLVMAGERHRIAAAASGHTERVLAGIAPQFVLLSTTANLLDLAPGTIGSGPQVYLLNLFKAEDRVESLPWAPQWFSIPPTGDPPTIPN